MSEQERVSGAPEDLRAEVLQSVAEDTRHGVISTPHSASVSINISPEAIPFDGVDKERLVQDLGERFGCRYQPPAGIPVEARAGATLESLMQASRVNGDMIVFVGGQLQLPGTDRVTPIRELAIGEQTLRAMVSGVSSEAMYLCKQLCLSLWSATRLTRRWDEFDDLVERVVYTTTTIVDLGVSLTDALSANVRKFLAEDVAADGGFGYEMGSLGAFVPAGGLQLVPYCRDITLKVAMFDPVSGEADDCTINLLLHTRADANRSRVKVTSELESAKHNEMALALSKRLKRR